MDDIRRFWARQHAIENRHEVFRAQFKVILFDLDASRFQQRPFVGGGRDAIVGVFGHDDDIIQAALDYPLRRHHRDHGKGGGCAEDIVDAIFDSGGPALEFDDAVGGDIVVPGTGEQSRNAVLLRHFHERQRHSAVIAADHAMHAIVKYPALGKRLTALGNAFTVAGYDFQSVIDAGDFDAAVGVDVVRRLLVCPVDDDASAGRAGGRKRGNAAKLNDLIGKIAMSVGVKASHWREHDQQRRADYPKQFLENHSILLFPKNILVELSSIMILLS